MRKGVDNGYKTTKDSNGIIFDSAYSNVDQMVTGSKHITIDGKNFYVGVGNNITVDPNKINKDVTKVCQLTNLAMSGDGDYYLVVGLPVDQYKSQHEKFKDTIMNYNRCEVIYDDQPLKFEIKDVTVFAQGVGAFYSQDIKNDAIMFDMGGLTLDVALIEIVNGMPTIAKSNTWFKGVLTLFSEVVKQLNNKFSLTLEPRNAEKILQQGLKVDGQPQDVSFLQDVLNDYIEPILTEFKLLYPYRTTDIYICGGGGKLLYNVLKRYLPNATLLPNSQFANANGFGKIAENLYSKYDSAASRLESRIRGYNYGSR
jgi:plasmid segregation protein ParM